jgi:hypothetical protein
MKKEKIKDKKRIKIREKQFWQMATKQIPLIRGERGEIISQL